MRASVVAVSYVGKDNRALNHATEFSDTILPQYDRYSV